MSQLHKERKIIIKITALALIANILLIALKLTLGILGKSQTVINSSIDSILDVIVAIVVIIFGAKSRKRSDKDHQYGHERIESVVSIILGMIMVVTAFELGLEAIKLIVGHIKGTATIKKPNYLAAIAMGSTIIIKVFLYLITRAQYRKARSQVLKTLATDHLTDSLVAFVAIIAVLFAILDVVVLEPIGALMVALCILYNGFMVVKSSVVQVIDQSADKETIKEIRETILSVPGVRRIDLMKTRQFGMKLYVDVEIAVDNDLTMLEAHEISHDVHDLVEETYPYIKHCMVHINPVEDKCCRKS